MFISLFSVFSFRCKSGKRKVQMRSRGTMVTVLQFYKHRGGDPFTAWRSQPWLLGGYPAGYLLLSVGVLLAGASITKVLLVLHHMRLSVYSILTFFRHEKKFLFPSILHHWETYRGVPIRQLKQTSNVAWTGDGRFDSMGHSMQNMVSTPCFPQPTWKLYTLNFYR